MEGIMKQKKSKKPSGNKMNMAIARTNQFSSRVVGMQLTSGTLIAVGLSMTQMATGFVFVTGITNLLGIVPIVLIGALLAILVESLNIGGLGAVRETTAAKKQFLDSYYASRREPTQRQIENKERKEKEFAKEIRSGWWFAGVGMVISIVLGDLFWHHLFVMGLGDTVVVYPLSFMCAAVITLTFVRAELCSGMLFRTLKGILKDNRLMKTAVNVEPENMQMDMLTSAMSTVREDEEVRQPIENKIGKVVVKRLSGFAESFHQISEEGIIEGQVTEIKQLAAPRQSKPRGGFVAHQERLQQYLIDHPDATVRDLAEHFGKSVSTMQTWLTKLNASA
jgi:hypothetical protein